MKIIFFLFLSTVCIGQNLPDTIYHRVNAVTSDKKVTITRIQEFGTKKVQDVDVYDKSKIQTEIQKITQDTAQYNQYLKMLDQQQKQIQNEKIRIRMILREAVRFLRKANDLIPQL